MGADDFTQVIINKFNSTINDARRELHRRNIQTEINRQNQFEKCWKMKTNVEKFQIIAIGYRKTTNIVSDGTNIPFKQVGKILGMEFTSYNFFTKQIKTNLSKARANLKKLWRFRYLKKNFKAKTI